MDRPTFAPRRPARLLRAGRLALAALTLAVALPGCATRRNGEAAAARADRPATTLVVDNQGFLDANIYVVRGSQRVRLGQAGGNRTTRFTIPAYLIFGVTSLQFQADPIGSQRAPISNEIGVTEGDQVRLVIPPR